MQNKRDIEILIGVLLIMSTVASIVTLILYDPIPNPTFDVIPACLFAINVLLGGGTLITAYLLRRANLVPGFFSTLGLISSLIILLRGILIMFGLFEQLSLWGILLAIPFFGYNVSLAILLFSKGFNETELPLPSKLNLFRLADKDGADR